MSTNRFLSLLLHCTLGVFLPASLSIAQQPGSKHTMRMVDNPSVSPDGSQIAFAWIGEIWTAGIDGSNIQRLTNNQASENQPLFSPDGKRIAFVSNRTGSNQIFVMDVDGSNAKQVTFHSAGFELCDWFPNGSHVLALGSRDHFHRDYSRLLKVNVKKRSKEIVLADAMAEDARLSPDGRKVLFTREGERWWRKGYQGARSAQIWMLDLKTRKFTQLVKENVECMWPTWMADSKGFYFTKGTLHGFDLWRYRFVKSGSKPGKQKKIHGFDDDSVVYPAASRDGETVIFRHLFDLYSLKVDEDAQPQQIQLVLDDDIDLPADELRRELSSASDVAFTKDGLEIAMIAGGDIWVMDSVLREPKQVTATNGYEDDLLFSDNGEELWFIGTKDGQADIWKATRKDNEKYWWQNDEFELEQITNDAHVESDLRFTKDGKQIVMQQGRGDLVVMDLKSKKKSKLVSSFSGIDYDISPDGNWITYSKQDNDFNREIWITKLDGSLEPVNVSRHPDNESNPRFSADGKLLAFTGRRVDREVDIYYVYLNLKDDDETSRQRKIDEAIDLMKKKRKAKPSAKKPEAKKPEDEKDKEEKKAPEAKPKKESGDKDEKESDKKDDANKDEKKSDEDTAPEYDLVDIHNRVRRISIPNSFESSLLFAPTGQKLAFSASIDGKSGWYTVEFPDQLNPKLLTASTGSGAVWSKEADAILFLRSGSPAKVDKTGKLTTYSFEVAQVTSRSGWLKAGFERAWLVMRESWYDERFANHNWNQIRRKYAEASGQMHDTSGLGQVVQLMLGELNGSHLGFTPFGVRRPSGVEGWRDETAHLGVRFKDDFKGPGLLVRDVMKDGPADRVESRLLPDDVILSIDGTAVDPAMDLTTVLNGRLDRDIVLKVKRESETDKKDEESEDGELEITIRPTSYPRARSLLYEHWLEHNRKMVDEGSDGKLGYLHIRGMNMSSFYEFERQLYNVGYGRDGLVIDVRDNGGGSTTDLLLTALTQPRHAITQPRGGGQGYPHDRAVFAAWTKPIIVLCNQNSYSNAEIFSHAIKTLGRGKVVGVPTAGGVVSTGASSVNDVGRIRVPFRGWFLLNDGEDMERNGCKPHEIVWPKPGELPKGIDRQLERAVEMLVEEVGDGEPEKKLRYAAERDKEAN